MKPSFALNITDTSIGLLHRTARGWLQVGETAFDTADLAEALGYLRGSALGLSPGGLTTKLVLPNSQIKYLELDAPGPEDSDRRNQIRAALVGRTPYNVDDLVFDWTGLGPKVQVAVVARETLDEAEAFATEHRFNPVSFVGAPPKGDFKGEPWFGPSKLSATLLEKGEKVGRDTDPVQIAARDLPKSHPSAAKPAAGPSGDAGDQAAKNVPPESDKPTRAQRRAAAAEQARAAEAASLAEGASLAEAETVSVEPPPIIASPDAQPIAEAFPEAVVEVVEDIRAWPKFDVPDQVVPEVSEQPAPPAHATVPSSASVTDSQAFPEVTTGGNATDAPMHTADDLPPAPSAASMAAFASRRATDLPGGNRASAASADPILPRSGSFGGQDLIDRFAAKSAPPPLTRPRVGGDLAPGTTALRTGGSAGETVSAPTAPTLDIAMARAGTSKPATAFVTAPNIPGSRKRKTLPAGATPTTGTQDARKSLTKPGGTFASAKQRGKPRYLGLILTVLLLVFLALIAAWSSFVVGSNDGADSGTAIVAAPPAIAPANEIANATAEVPAVDDEILADSQDPADFDPQIVATADADIDPAADLAANSASEIAAPDTTPGTADLPAISAVDPASEPAPEPAPALEPAPVGVAVTESPSAAPLDEAQDEIFLAAIDTSPLVLDPLALPLPGVSNDALPLPQLEPPPFGTVYQFDADGQIRPTPEGIITPEGVRLVAGKPSLLPPQRPDALIATSQATAQDGAVPAAEPVVAAPFPSDPALAEARPRPRPADLVPPAASEQADDDALLAAPGATRVTSIRPLPRPAASLAAGEAARQSTAAASLTAQAAAVEAAVQAAFQPDPNGSPLAVPVSRKPAPRPKDMTRAVEAAVAAAVRAPEPQRDAQIEADEEPEGPSAAPAIPTRASVAKQATYVNAINLAKINLIGVYGTKSSRYALIRQANGNYKKVKVGDSIDGGRVAAIGSDEVRYQKSGRMVSLKLPKI